MAFSHYGSASSAITNKFDKFAEGIYTALITTFAVYVVAIPAAILCSFLEGRIVTLFHNRLTMYWSTCCRKSNAMKEHSASIASSWLAIQQLAQRVPTRCSGGCCSSASSAAAEQDLVVQLELPF